MSDLNQEQKLLKALRKAGSHGIPNYSIHSLRILSHTKVISNLRREGFTILKERLRLPSGRYTQIYQYTLVEEPEENWLKSLWRKK